jgi:hypothetical protein
MTDYQRLLNIMIEVEAKYGEVENDSLGRRYEDGLNALQSNSNARHFLAAVRLEQWVAAH